jgi:hypothetical protein
MSRPADVARFLARCGLSLQRAHQILDKLANGERISVKLARREGGPALVRAFGRLGVTASARQGAHAP